MSVEEEPRAPEDARTFSSDESNREPAGDPLEAKPAPGEAPPAPPSASDDSEPAPDEEPKALGPRKGLLGRPMDFILGPRKPRRKRSHPYAHEASPEEETRLDPRRVTLLWFALASVTLIAGLYLNLRFSPFAGSQPLPEHRWDQWTNIPLFTGLALLGFGFTRESWSKRLTMGGWILFGFYWALTGLDLFYGEEGDFVNATFAFVGVYFFTYIAYHQWLSALRGVKNDAVHFLNVATFIAAGSYFVIAKITFLRVWLIQIVGQHTKWGLDAFGQGDKKGITFIINREDTQGPVTFWYPDTRYTCPDGKTRADVGGDLDALAEACTSGVEGWREFLFWTPGGSDLLIVPVSIILACTAIQSIMLFVGLFAGTQAHWKRKLYASLVVGAIIYVLNLIRNVGIIWFYGQGHSSFWMMHNAIGKGGSLLAMVVIAFGVFKFFPEFFRALIGVIELPDRDGPIERTLKIGRRRPAMSPESSVT